MATARKLESVGIFPLKIRSGGSLHIVNTSSSPSTISIYIQDMQRDAFHIGLVMPTDPNAGMISPTKFETRITLYKSIVIPVGVSLILDNLKDQITKLLSSFTKNSSYIELEVGTVDIIMY